MQFVCGVPIIGLLFISLTVQAVCIRRKPVASLLWAPITLFWAAMTWILFVNVHLGPVTGWFGEALFNLIIIATRVLSVGLLLLCIVRPPLPDVFSFWRAALGVSIELIVFGTIATGWYYSTRHLYTLTARDGAGHPITHFSARYRYTSWDLSWHDANVESDATGTLAVSTHDPVLNITVSVPGGPSPHQIEIFNGHVWDNWDEPSPSLASTRPTQQQRMYDLPNGIRRVEITFP